MVGAAIVVSERVALVAYFDPKLMNTEYLPWWWVPSILLPFWLAVVFVFILGIMIIGMPAWLALKRFGAHGWLVSILLGGLLASAFYILFVKIGLLSKWVGPFTGAVGGTGSRFSDKDILLRDAACLFIAGALAGLSIWGIAHERNVAIGVHADNALRNP